MTPPVDPLDRLVARCRTLWAAEAAIFEAYWDSPTRTPATDLAWLARQCHKELVDGLEPRLAAVADRLAEREGATPFGPELAPLDSLLVEAHEELRHLDLFLAAWRAIAGPEVAPPGFGALRAEWGWPENDALMALRREHVAVHGVLGARASVLTEGGGASLYESGAARRGRGPHDDAIADACASVADDERTHAAVGIRSLGEEGLDAAQWALLEELTVAQLQARLAMRNAQFGHPLSAEELATAVDA